MYRETAMCVILTSSWWYRSRRLVVEALARTEGPGDIGANVCVSALCWADKCPWSSAQNVEITYLHLMPRSEVLLFRSIESPEEDPGSNNRSFVRHGGLKWNDIKGS